MLLMSRLRTLKNVIVVAKSKSQELVGKKIGMLNVVSLGDVMIAPNGTRQQMFNCVCDCGKSTVVSYSHLKYGGTKSCGCIKHMPRFEDLTGKVFSRLTVIKHLGRKSIGSGKQYSQLWECRCDCGNVCKVNSRDLKSGNTKSCGCIQGESLRESNLNNYDLSGEYGIGFFNDGTTFLFDLEDFPLIKDFTWHKNDNGYVVTTYKNKRIRMHRLVLRLGDYNLFEEVDHKNHNRNDNRKSNLRICTHRENMFNRVDPSNNTSGHIGVSQDSSNGKYKAYIGIYGKYISLGDYSDYNEAVAARENGEKKYFAEFAIARRGNDIGRSTKFISEASEDTCVV